MHKFASCLRNEIMNGYRKTRAHRSPEQRPTSEQRPLTKTLPYLTYRQSNILLSKEYLSRHQGWFVRKFYCITMCHLPTDKMAISIFRQEGSQTSGEFSSIHFPFSHRHYCSINTQLTPMRFSLTEQQFGHAYIQISYGTLEHFIQ